MRRFFIPGCGQAGFQLGDAVVGGFQPLFQPLDLALLVGHHLGQLVNRALLFSGEHFQGIEAVVVCPIRPFQFLTPVGAIGPAKSTGGSFLG